MTWRSHSAQRHLVASILIGVPCLLTGGGEPGFGLVAQEASFARVSGRVPQVEVRAPGAFDQRASPTAAHRVRYQVNATVLFPLFSIPFAHRDNVGFAVTSVQDFSNRASGPLRTHELFAASFPERARGLNRMGFIREAVGLEQDGARWTAHFGALSSNPETSRKQVDLDSDERLRAYTVMDGFTDSHRSWNRDVRLHLEGSWSSPEDFYETLIPIWRTKQLEPLNASFPQTVPGYPEPLGFLGIVIHSLRVAAEEVHQGSEPRRTRYPFAHKGELMYLFLRGHGVDGRRQRRYVEDGLVQSGAVLHRLDYRILDDDGDVVQKFKLWTELPAGRHDRRAAPIMPVAFEFKAKSFLKLEAVRVSESTTYPDTSVVSSTALVWELAQPHRDLDRPTRPPQSHQYHLTWLIPVEDGLEFQQRGDRLVFDSLDHVARNEPVSLPARGPKTSVRGTAFRVDVKDEHTRGAETLHHGIADRCPRHEPEAWRLILPGGDQMGDDPVDGVHGNREPDSGRCASGCRDRRIDTDDPSRAIEQRTA